MSIGSIDDIQKLHIRTVPLGEQPRRIAHQEQTRTLAVCCVSYTQARGGDTVCGMGGARATWEVPRVGPTKFA